jgi:hypothetical protein
VTLLTVGGEVRHCPSERRSPDDDEGVTHSQVRPDLAFGLLELYDDALPHVYGYLLARCGDTGLAEELTAESSATMAA